LGYFWQYQLNNNIAFQTGKIGNSRIDFGGTRLVTTAEGQESYIGGRQKSGSCLLSKTTQLFSSEYK
jgi:hypothetical protein